MLNQAVWLVLSPQVLDHERKSHVLYECTDEFDPQVTRQTFHTFSSRTNTQHLKKWTITTYIILKCLNSYELEKLHCNSL